MKLNYLILLSFLVISIMFATLTCFAEVERVMTPSKIEEAIQYGKNGDLNLKHYRIQEKSAWGKGPLVGYFTTPFARVAFAAKQAYEEYRTFSIDDVTDDMIEPMLHVYGTSRVQDGSLVSAKVIVIMPYKNEDLSKVVKPSIVRTLDEEYYNLFGASWEGQSLMAVFPLSLLSESNEVHVVFDAELNTGSSVAKCCCKDCKMRFDLDKVR